MTKTALGKGLGALIPKKDSQNSEFSSIDISLIDLNPQQPRQDFDPESLNELKSSIQQNGLLQPLLVRRQGQRYELIAGERRFRAVRELGLATVSVIVKEASDVKSLEWALIENIQRENLNPMEEAKAYMRLMRDYELSQDIIAERVGKNRATVANFLRLVHLNEEIQEMIERGEVSFGHAKAILGLENPADQIHLAKEIVSLKLSVREAEDWVQEKRKRPIHKTRALKQDPAIREFEERIEKSLQTKIRIRQGRRKGRIEIDYYSLDDLERLVGRLAAEKI